MSVRDYTKILDIKNMCTGEVFERIDFDDDNFCSFGDNVFFFKSTIGDIRLLRAIHDCLDNEHGCLITIGYKNT